MIQNYIEEKYTSTLRSGFKFPSQQEMVRLLAIKKIRDDNDDSCIVQ